MKIAVIQFPGSNCERETMQAIQRVGMQPISFLWNDDEALLRDMDGFVIVGGFSYEDRSRAGALAALDPIMTVIKQQSKLGKPILGICNGAQILVEAGLVPGVEDDRVAMALTDNQREIAGNVLATGYYNEWVWMRLSDQYQRNAFTKHLTRDHILHVPVAHAEGRFVLGEGLAQEIRENGLNVFQYCDQHGEHCRDFPINPNGSWENTAAISNKRGNVLAMMPHPERTTTGDVIFSSMRDYILGEPMPLVEPLHYYPRKKEFSVYQHMINHDCMIISDLIDLAASSVQSTLQRLGYDVTVRTYRHWRVLGSADALSKALASEELFNPRKERIMSSLPDSSSPSEQAFLVKAKQNWHGRATLQTLIQHHALDAITSVESAVIWQFSSSSMSADEISRMVEQTGIIHNPYAQECYFFNRK